MKWSGQHIYDLVSRFRNDVIIEGSDGSSVTIDSNSNRPLKIYQPVVDANPKIRIGASDTEMLQIRAFYQAGTQEMQVASFATFTAETDADRGKFQFTVDDTNIVAFLDDGIDLYTGKGIAINGTDILTDSSGTATLSNIDALDATTIATFEAALSDSTTDSLVIDTDISAAQGDESGDSFTALHVDFDRIAPDSGTYAHNDIGIDLDVTSASLGGSSLKGMDIDVVGATSGASRATGIDLTVSGADVNNGIQVLCEGEQLRLSHNAQDYAKFTVADTGDLTIATVGDGTTDSDLILNADGVIDLQPADGKSAKVTSTEASSSSAGGKLNLVSDDGAALGDDHMLGRLGFLAAEDSSSTYRLGASIQAFADAAWSASENGTRLEFYTMDGNNTSELSLTLDSDLLATFAGAVTVTGTITGDVTGDLTGEAATVATIAGLAPNTATTQATQGSITSCANLVTVGTIGTGVWNATAIASAKMATGTASAQGALELATTGEADTGTDTARAVTPAGLKSHVDTRYSYSYITLSASAKPTKDGSDNPEWMVPNINKGIYEEDWNFDTGITSVTTGTTTYGFSRYTTVNSFIIPHAGILVGFHGIGRNGTADRTFKAGLFHADNGLGGAGADGSVGEGIDYGNNAATNEFSLRCVATASEGDKSGGTDGTTNHVLTGPCQLISNSANLQLQAGDALMPAIMGNDTGATDEIFVSMTIILKIPLA